MNPNTTIILEKLLEKLNAMNTANDGASTTELTRFVVNLTILWRKYWPHFHLLVQILLKETLA